MEQRTIMQEIMGLDFSFLIFIALYAVVIAGIYWWARRLAPKWRVPINLILAIVVIRIVLFYNPLAWYTYSQTLDPEVIGWRQSSVLYDEFVQYKDHEEVRYLIVGSSQAEAVFNHYSYNSPDYKVKSLAAMGPLDLYLYRHNILSYKPQAVVLYLSDFDMGREPTLNASKLAPSQRLALPKIYLNLRSRFAGEELNPAMKEMLIGEIFPEYKYAFIFNGYLDQWFGKEQVFDVGEPAMSEESRTEYQFRQLANELNKDNLDINFYYVEEFITFFTERDIPVRIIEGQYHPEAYTGQNLAIRREVRNRFLEMEQHLADVAYIPESETLPFEPEDYRDAYHVHDEAGIRFSQHVSGIIESIDR